jgi:putative transposase
MLEALATERGAPELLRCDNRARDDRKCAQGLVRAFHSKAGTAFIDPGSPWQNPFVESFHSRVRDELLDAEEFSCLAEARVVISD